MIAHGLFECGDIDRLVVRMNQGLPAARTDLLRSGRKELFISPVDELNLAGDAGDPQDRGGSIGHGAEAFFAFLERELGAPVIGDVVFDGDEAGDLLRSVRRPERCASPRHRGCRPCGGW